MTRRPAFRGSNAVTRTMDQCAGPVRRASKETAAFVRGTPALRDPAIKAWHATTRLSNPSFAADPVRLDTEAMASTVFRQLASNGHRLVLW